MGVVAYAEIMVAHVNFSVKNFWPGDFAGPDVESATRLGTARMSGNLTFTLDIGVQARDNLCVSHNCPIGAGLGTGEGVKLSNLNEHRPVYPISVVRKLTGLSERQIRYYGEKGLVVPWRTSGGQRLYSSFDVDNLRRIKLLLGKGRKIDEIKGLFAQDRGGQESADTPEALLDLKEIDSGEATGARKPLVSLYPVPDQAALVEIIDRLRERQDRWGRQRLEKN